jgi:hypothetical protein
VQREIEIEAGPNPLAGRAFAALEGKHHNQRQRDQQKQCLGHWRQHFGVECRMQREGDSEARQARQHHSVGIPIRQRATDNRHDRGGRPLQDRRAKPSHHPQRDRRVGDRAEVPEIFDEREPGTDRKPLHRRIDQERNPCRCYESANQQRFGDFLRGRGNQSPNHRQRHVGALNQPFIQRQRDSGSHSAIDDRRGDRRTAHQLKWVHQPQRREKNDHRHERDDGIDHRLPEDLQRDHCFMLCSAIGFIGYRSAE